MTSIEEKLFAEATALPLGERKGYLDKVCANDVLQRQRLEVLLAAHEGKNGILDLENTDDESGINLDIDEGQEVGPYRLLEKIGEGGFGVVFMAEQQRPVQRKVAIKIIKPGMDSKAVIARFESERQALAIMDHPNIAQIFGGGTSEVGQRPYFVMELVQGVPITDFCDANSLTTRERMELFISVCNAVHHAHQKGIIHRDIKPNNVMVTLHDGKPVVKVIDFGVAKALHQRLTDKTLFTRYGVMVGTPQYMSPEQAEMTGLDVDTRSDVYSLAVLLYELMTGTTPLNAKALRTAGIKEMQRLICEDEAVRPSLRLSSSGKQLTIIAKHRGVTAARLPKELQGDLDWIILKGLEKNRKHRYDSANDLAADIQRALDNHPVHAGPPSIAYRTRKFVARHHIGLALSAAALMIVVAIALGLLNHRNHQLAAIQKDETQLNRAIDQANEAVVTAVDAPASDEHWKAADLLVARINQLIKESSLRDTSLSRAEQFLERYRQARADREFTFSIEELLISKSTDQTMESLQYMDREFQNILRKRGYDLETQSPNEIGRQLSKDRTPIKLTDALELWISTRMKLSNAGGKQISATELSQWTEAMCTADPNPMRAAIRNTIFHTVLPDPKQLDNAVTPASLNNACARKLSWLADAYQLVGQPDRSDEIREFALAQHPGDLMLNFEHATYLMKRERYDLAIRYFMRCTSIRPGIPGVWRSLAEACRSNDEISQARDAIEKAIQLAPTDASLHLQSAQWLLKDGESQAALAAAEMARSLNPETPAAWRVIGRANMKLQNYVQALVAFEQFQARADDDERESVDPWILECRQLIAIPDKK